MTVRCHCCGEEYHDPLPIDTTEQQARNALRAVLQWYAESPIREIEMASAACGIPFPIKEIEAAVLAH